MTLMINRIGTNSFLTYSAESGGVYNICSLPDNEMNVFENTEIYRYSSWIHGIIE